MTTALDTRPAARARHVAVAVVAGAAVGLLVLAPDLVGEHGRLVAVLVLQAVLVAGWVPATAAAGAGGVTVLGAAAAVGADLAVGPLAPSGDQPGPGLLLAVAGPALIAAVLHQMLRRPPRTDVVGSLGSVALLVAAVCALALLLLPDVPGDEGDVAGSPLVVVGAALVAGHLVDAVLPRPAVADGADRGVPGLLAAVVAGVAVALSGSGTAELVDVVSGTTTGLVLGLVAALAGTAASFVLGDWRGRGAAAGGVAVEAVLPLAVCAPVLLALAVV
ncbi:hypothetical protein JD79_01779 [Geodermatophilus normandii]|uniref:Uncharacterized protein n=1 Tax=Geodermatophilus normandii TaxID=1137989 RepID=A0A317QIM9_9ACTN|nr:hypothetical protein [Geodermatophilus normandii]PWW22621.1 hypothetical protein JD79_01779 [Geodermatophilus normandii]